MNDYLIEIIFKNVPIERIAPLLKDLISDPENIVDYNLPCGPENIDLNSEKSLKAIFFENKSFGLFINLKELNKYEICLPHCGIAVYKNENIINLELNFQLSELKKSKNNNLLIKLMNFGKSISTLNHIDEYFCGFEPAEDESTRLFTNDQLGPFQLA